eukprot:TRINITY_DN355_c0_g1_i4.p1 TRINITY_DN355_c0_g1~~TRINITY_DN355_c0_g1_i4.p1  ORF type:complete len:208 (+),score=71.10 TRINITY_DN355_c0_g1_i4:3-626(+)
MCFLIFVVCDFIFLCLFFGPFLLFFFFFFFFKQKTAYEMQRGLVGSEMCIRDRYQRRVHGEAQLEKIPGFKAYIELTCEGIPIQVKNISEDKAVTYAALVMDLVMKTNLMLHNPTTKNEEELKSIRMRTKKGIEIIVTITNNFILIVLQDCTKVAEVKLSEARPEGEEPKQSFTIHSYPHVLCVDTCLLYTSPSPRDLSTSRMPSSA